MTNLKVELPVKLNGAIVTPGVLYFLNFVQSEFSFDNPSLVYDNEGVKSMCNDIDELYNYIIGHIANADSDTDISKETQLIVKLYYLRENLNHCRVPDEFITK